MNFEEQKKNILNSFDFDCVHAVMVLTDWQWQGEGVPSKEALIEHATEMLDSLHARDTDSIFSGGFHVEKYMNELGETEYVLSFVLESCGGI